MRNIKLGETGRRLTKYKCYIGFYDFSKLQGKFFGTLAKICGLSNITHVGPIILIPGVGEISITICEGKIVDGFYKTTARVHKEGVLERTGAVLVHRKYVGEFVFDLEDVMRRAETYTDAHPWDILFHQFIGRFLGLTRPRACSSFVCDLFKLQEYWHPASIYRKYK